MFVHTHTQDANCRPEQRKSLVSVSNKEHLLLRQVNSKDWCTKAISHPHRRGTAITLQTLATRSSLRATTSTTSRRRLKTFSRKSYTVVPMIAPRDSFAAQPATAQSSDARQSNDLGLWVVGGHPTPSEKLQHNVANAASAT